MIPRFDRAVWDYFTLEGTAKMYGTSKSKEYFLMTA